MAKKSCSVALKPNDAIHDRTTDEQMRVFTRLLQHRRRTVFNRLSQQEHKQDRVEQTPFIWKKIGGWEFLLFSDILGSGGVFCLDTNTWPTLALPIAVPRPLQRLIDKITKYLHKMNGYWRKYCMCVRYNC